MAYIIETPNAFEPLNSIKHRVDGPLTIRQWVLQKHPSGEFPVATICVVNGEGILRKDWDRPIAEKDIVNFVALPAGLEAVVIAAIVLVVLSLAVTLVMMMNQPKSPGETPSSDPVFSTKGQENAIRVGEPIEVCYGRNRIYPSYASRPYFEYRDNQQYQFSLFCLGQGEYEIEAIQIGDTTIANYQEVEYEVAPPGVPVTLFPTAVYSAPEAGGQQMYGPNEPEYVDPGWIGPFSCNPSGTTAHTIQMDFVMPKGLYRQTKSGGLDTTGLTFEAQIRLVDDFGSPLGDWQDFITGTPEIAITGKTQTPQRRTYLQEVTSGRYEARVRKVSLTTISSQFGQDIVWDGLRSYLDQEQNFGDVTLLAVKIQATNNLNENTQQQFNVIATRKLPIRESAGFTDPQPTRSIIWAFVDCFRSRYGGRVFDDKFYDWDALEALDDLYTSRGEYFDWCFRDPITAWEGATTIARVGRAIPLLAGSLITIKRDGPIDFPVALFNQENIVKNSFEYDIKLWDLDEYDSVRVEYTDPDQGYTQQTVLATLPGGTTDHPQDVRFSGIQDRTHAYREGLYMQAVALYLRENFQFETGNEGFIPTFGDLIAVVHDTPKNGQGGYVVQAERGVDFAYKLWLSTPVTFEESSAYQIILRKRNADLLGPFDVVGTSDPQQVLIYSEEDIDFLLDGTTEPMLFVFGLQNETTRYVKVASVEPLGGERIRITAVNEDARIHSFDTLSPAPLNQNPYAPIPPDLPEVIDLRITQTDSILHIVQASWNAAFGAQYYVIQTSTDGVFWRERVTTTRTSFEFQAVPGDLYVRVAGVNSGQGPWTTKHVDVLHLVAITLTEEWTDLEWAVSWLQVLGATSYLVRVYDNSGSSPVLKREETLAADSFSAIYDYADATEDGNLVREMLVEVEPVFPPEEAGESASPVTPASLELSNDIPEAPMHPQFEISSVESDSVVYRISWDLAPEEDLHRLKIWVSPTNNFDPNLVAPVVDETTSEPGSEGMPVEAFVSIDLDSAGDHPVQYFRIAVFDVYGNEISSNITAQQTIPAYS